MAHLPVELLATCRRQYGLLTIDQLTAHDVGRHARSSMLRRELLLPVHDGVYRLATHDVTFLQSCLAACLALPHVAVSGPSGGRLYDLRRMPSGPVHVLARQKVTLDGVVAHRTVELGGADILHRGDGIRVLRPVRLVPDLARFLDDHDLESVIEQLLDRRAVSVPALFASARRLRRSGRDGSLRLARVLQSRPAWMRPKDSELERKVLRALADRGVVLETQIELDAGGVTIHVDAGDRARRFGLEIDHVTWHGGRLQTQQDKWRDRQVARMGWLIARVTDEDVDRRFRATIDDIEAIYHLRPAA